MDKLNKRQKILIAIAAMFLVYALYEIFIASPVNKKFTGNERRQEMTAVVTGLTSDLTKDAQSAGIDAYIITRAEADWQKNPFWNRTSYKEWAAIQGAAGGSGSAVKIIYSGYVDAGNMKIAIINGLEYRVGEQLEMEGYMLKRITPSKVLIANKDTGSEVEISIQE